MKYKKKAGCASISDFIIKALAPTLSMAIVGVIWFWVSEVIFIPFEYLGVEVMFFTKFLVFVAGFVLAMLSQMLLTYAIIERKNFGSVLNNPSATIYLPFVASLGVICTMILLPGGYVSDLRLKLSIGAIIFTVIYLLIIELYQLISKLANSFKGRDEALKVILKQLIDDISFFIFPKRKSLRTFKKTPLKLDGFAMDKCTRSSFIRTNDGRVVGGIKIELPPVVLCSSAEKMSFFDDFRKEISQKLDQGTGIQFFIRRGNFRERELINQVYESKEAMGNTELDGVFKEMYKERAAYLKSTGANSFEIYLFFWKDEILKESAFASSSEPESFDLYEEKLAKLLQTQHDILNILDSCSCAGKYIKTTSLSKKKLESLMFEQLCPSQAYNAMFPVEIKSKGKSSDLLRPLYLNRGLLAKASYDAGFIKHDGQYSKVLTLRKYPPKLNWNHFEFINSMRGNFHISLSITRTSKKPYKKAKSEENSSFDVSYQVVLNGYDVADLDWRAQKVMRSFSEEGLCLVAEDYTHHEQYFNTLPGLGMYQDRVFTEEDTKNLCSMIPLNLETPEFDKKASFVLNNKLGHLSSISLKSDKVSTGNSLIMATAGEGKSVLLASILCNIALSGPRSGNVIILDYAGEESGYKNLCSMTGGKFVNLMKQGQYSLNPFLGRDAIIKNGKIVEERLSQMISMVEVATAVDKKTMKDYLFEPIIKTAIENLYFNWKSNRPPIFSDLLREVNAISPGKYFKRHHLNKISQEIHQVTNGKISWLVNSNKNPVEIKDRFTIIDIKGFDLYPQKEKDFIAYIVISKINDAMSAAGRKYVFMDEIGRYLFSPRLQKMVETIYTTARKYDCPVLLINQTFEKFANSEVKDAITANIGNLFLLRQADPEQAEKMINHFQFDDTVAAFYKNLPSVSQNKYSTILWKHGTEFNVVELKLTPFEYELMTSDPTDRKALERLKQQNPDMTLKDVLRLRAEERLQGLANKARSQEYKEKKPKESFDGIILGSGIEKELLMLRFMYKMVLSGDEQGPAVVIDSKGEEVSSYKPLCSLLNGNFISLIKESGKTINPFKQRAEIVKKNKVVKERLNEMVLLLEYSIAMDLKSSKEKDLVKEIIISALEGLYLGWKKEEAPTFSDFLKELEQMHYGSTLKMDCLTEIRKEIEKIINGKISWLINSNKNPLGKIEAGFTVIDIKGFERYAKRDQELIVYIVMSLINDAVLSKRIKHVFLDKADKYLYSARIQSKMQKIYDRASKMGSRVTILIDEDFEAFLKSKLNKTSEQRLSYILLLKQEVGRSGDKIEEHFKLDAGSLASFVSTALMTLPKEGNEVDNYMIEKADLDCKYLNYINLKEKDQERFLELQKEHVLVLSELNSAKKGGCKK